MPKNLIAARDEFAGAHPERRFLLGGRDWGGIRIGDAGPALLLIPGTLGRADIFWQQMAALAGKARIVALSYPSSGGIAEWADDIAELIRREGLEGAVVLGSSLGGYLAQYLAATHADLLGGLVAANTLPSVRGIDQLPPYSLDLMQTPIADLRAGFSNGLSQWAVPDHPYRELAELLLDEVRGRIPEPELRARLQALKVGPELPAQTLPRQRRFTVESGDDHLIAPDWQQRVRGLLQPARAYRFQKASHFPYVTRPVEYTALLAEVLGLARPGTTWPDGQEALL